MNKAILSAAGADPVRDGGYSVSGTVADRVRSYKAAVSETR